jgi:hypothetical protein
MSNGCGGLRTSGRLAQVAAPSADPRENLTWELFGTATRELAVAIHADGFRPDVILGIARGGLFVAGALGYALDVKNLHLANVEFYTGVDERLRHRGDAAAGEGLLRRPCRRGALRGRVREGPLDGAVRVRVAPHRSVDQLPVVR